MTSFSSIVLLPSDNAGGVFVSPEASSMIARLIQPELVSNRSQSVTKRILPGFVLVFSRSRWIGTSVGSCLFDASMLSSRTYWTRTKSMEVVIVDAHRRRELFR